MFNFFSYIWGPKGGTQQDAALVTPLDFKSQWDYSSEEESEENQVVSEEFRNPQLLEMVRADKYDEIVSLLKQNADPNFQDEHGYTALYHAINRTKPNLETIKLLLENKAEPQNQAEPQNKAAPQNQAESQNKAEPQNQANPNIKDNDGNTALHHAAKKHNIEVAELLIKSKADVNIQNNKGIFPYQYVKTYCDKTLVHLLEPEQQSLNRQLLQAVHTKNYDDAKKLLKENADPNIRDTLGRGPLTWAIMNNDPNMVKLLIKNKANIAHLNQNGLTASEVAVQNEHYEIAFILQQNLYQQNTFLVPLLHQVVKEQDTKMVAALVKRGVDVKAKSENGDTALTIAEEIKNAEIIDLLKKPSIVKQKNQAVINRLLQVAAIQDMVSLLQKLINMGGDINNPYIDDGNTALHYAAMHNNINAVTLLIQNKADITIKNKRSETALDIGQLVAKNIEFNIQQNSNNQDTNLKDLSAHQEKNKQIINLISSLQEQQIESAQEKQIEVAPEQKHPVPQAIDLWGGAWFDSLLEESEEEQRPNDSEEASEVIEEENESETQKIAIFPAKKALNKHIVAIKAANQNDEKNANSELDALQQKITEKREIGHKQIIDQNVDEVKSNSESIKNSIKQLAQNNENPKVLNNLLIIATTQSDSDTIKSLLENEHVDPNFVDDNGCSALHYAAIQGDAEKVELLLAKGAQVDIQDEYGNTPLHAAVILKRTDVITSLLQKGANVNIQDEYGNTASHFAAEAGYQKAIDLLHKKNADFTIKDHDNFTALDHAIKSTKDTRDNIDSLSQATQDESSSQDSDDDYSSTSSPQQYCYPKLCNLIHTIENLVSTEAVKQQDNAKFLLDTQFPTLLKSLNARVDQQNSADHNILESLDDVFGRWHEPTSLGHTSIVENLMQPICE